MSVSQSIHEERRPSSEAVIAPKTDPSRDALQVFLDQVGRHPLLAPWEEVQLAKRIEEGDEAARERMIASNLRLVVSLARRGHRNRSDLSLHDLIQDGIVGLIVAVERFDWRRGCRFSTYACWWIRQTMDRGTTGQIGVPFHLREAGRRLDAAEHRLEKQLGRRPTEDELAAATGLAVNRVARVRENLMRTAVVSLDSSPDDAEGGTLGDSLAAETDVFQEASAAEEQEELHEAIDRLPEKSRQVVTLRFGLRGHEPLSLREVGRRFGLSAQRIGQIEKQALAALGRTLGMTSNGDGEPQWRERVRDFVVVVLPEALRSSLPQKLSVGVATGVAVAAGGAALVSPAERPGPLDQGPAVVEAGEPAAETSDRPAREATPSGDAGAGGSVPVVDAQARDVGAGKPPGRAETPWSGEVPVVGIVMPTPDVASVDDTSVAASFGEEIQSDQVQVPEEADGHSVSDDRREDVSDESTDEATNPPGHGGSPPPQEGSSGQGESTLGEDGSSGQGKPTPGENGSSGESGSQPGQDGSPGNSGSAPGHGGSPPGQGETPPGRDEGSAGNAETGESETEGVQPPPGDARAGEPESDEGDVSSGE